MVAHGAKLLLQQCLSITPSSPGHRGRGHLGAWWQRTRCWTSGCDSSGVGLSLSTSSVGPVSPRDGGRVKEFEGVGGGGLGGLAANGGALGALGVQSVTSHPGPAVLSRFYLHQAQQVQPASPRDIFIRRRLLAASKKTTALRASSQIVNARALTVPRTSPLPPLILCHTTRNASPSLR